MNGVLIRNTQRDAPSQMSPLQVSQHAVMGGQQFRRRDQQTLAQRSERHCLVVPIEQTPARYRLKPLDMHTDCRGAFVKLLGSRRKLPYSRHGMKSTYQFDIENCAHDS